MSRRLSNFILEGGVVTYRGVNSQLTGEYANVCELTSHWYLMRLAMSLKLDEERTLILIEQLYKKHNISFKDAVIRITGFQERAWGGHKNKKKKVAKTGKLLRKAKRVAFTSFNRSHLDVHIVLHEVSHAIMRMRQIKGQAHGREFIATLDKLLVYYFSEIYKAS